ncbi:hypothetical protein N7520_003105 [Penicillium odoratum]|uniref:uncharacterized protein n=1 Tax=Penicillium odoratum TaxID=1167516 RepID=UPI0025470FCA|nr:uncharacterized protein N7520_003105 [Penicillium odoratum]KAJ5772576.1 hypothetical protein N7520_003105 [Penicillium odoratum]
MSALQGGKGPWSRCVVVNLPELGLVSCASCHWNGKFQRCSFYRQANNLPLTGPIPGGHQRGASQSSTTGEASTGDERPTTQSGGASHETEDLSRVHALHRDYAALKATGTMVLAGIDLASSSPDLVNRAQAHLASFEQMDSTMQRFS